MALSDKHKRFVEEYLVDLNATQAYIRAGYSENGANAGAARLLADVSIQEAVRERFEEARRDKEVTPERVIREFARLAYSDMRAVAEWSDDGVRFRPSSELTDDEAASIKSVKSVTTTDPNGVSRTHVEVQQHDKPRSLDSLGRYLALFVDRKEITTGDDGFVVKMRGLPDKTRGDGTASPDQV